MICGPVSTSRTSCESTKGIDVPKKKPVKKAPRRMPMEPDDMMDRMDKKSAEKVRPVKGGKTKRQHRKVC